MVGLVDWPKIHTVAFMEKQPVDWNVFFDFFLNIIHLNITQKQIYNRWLNNPMCANMFWCYKHVLPGFYLHIANCHDPQNWIYVFCVTYYRAVMLKCIVTVYFLRLYYWKNFTHMYKAYKVNGDLHREEEAILSSLWRELHASSLQHLWNAKKQYRHC